VQRPRRHPAAAFNARYTFATFVVGSSNKFAQAAWQAVAIDRRVAIHVRKRFEQTAHPHPRRLRDRHRRRPVLEGRCDRSRRTGLEEEVERSVPIPLGKGFAGRVAAERHPSCWTTWLIWKWEP
jgi:hypothetical protein